MTQWFLERQNFSLTFIRKRNGSLNTMTFILAEETEQLPDRDVNLDNEEETLENFGNNNCPATTWKLSVRDQKWKMWPIQVWKCPCAPKAQIKLMTRANTWVLISAENKRIKRNEIWRWCIHHLKKWSYKIQKMEPRILHLDIYQVHESRMFLIQKAEKDALV